MHNHAYGLWIPQSPDDLLKQSQTIFVGNITSTKVLEFAKSSVYHTEDNGIERQIIENYTLALDEYTVNVEQFLKNPQNSDTMVVRQPTTSIPGMVVPIGGFEIGDRVLFYVEKIDNENMYSPESFEIPTPCDANMMLSKPRFAFGSDMKMMQNGVQMSDNFTAGIPIKFVYGNDVRTLEGKGFDIDVGINKITDNKAKPVFREKFRAEANPCEWIASAEWTITPQAGKHSMAFTIYDDDGDTISHSEQFLVKGNTSLENDSPLKQLKSGISIDEIQCKEGLELILKASDGSPTCVSPETKQLLIERGWAKSSRSISKEFSHTLGGESKGSFDIHGSVDRARLSEISFDEHLNQLTIELEESRDGQLTITVPRELFKTDLGNDPDFMVIIDKEESTYYENKTNTDSTLSISFPTKTKEIWIVGTYPVSYPTLPDDAVLQVTADAPCAWMTLQQLPHSELLKQHDRTGRNALMLEINDDDISKVPHLKEMITAMQSEFGFEPYEYDENTWQKRITSTESEQQQIWDWLKKTSDSQFGQLSDHSFTTYFTYQDKFYHTIWALC